jgi:hypothetical protein
MKDIKLKTIILLILASLLFTSIVVAHTHSPMVVWEVISTDEDFVIDPSPSGTDNYYAQKITLDDDIVQIDGISLYVKSETVKSRLFSLYINDTLPDPNDLTTGDMLFAGTFASSAMGEGWYYKELDGWDSPSSWPDYANVSGGDYYLILKLWDLTPTGDKLTLGSGPVLLTDPYWGDYVAKKINHGANTWDNVLWDFNNYYGLVLDHKVHGKRYNVTLGTGTQAPTSTTFNFPITINHCANESTQVGYLLRNASGTIDNISYSSYSTPQTVWPTVSSLDPGNYYYVRPWSSNSFGFINSTEEYYMLTKPTKPTNLNIDVNITNVTFSWNNSEVGATTNRTTVLVASETNYPQWTGSAWSNSGVEIYNDTGTTTNVFLDPYTTYYVSAYTYINASGSPTYWWYSDLFSFDSFTTTGSEINVTARWECNDTIVNLSAGSYYATAETSTGTILNETVINSADGNFTISTDTRPDKISIITNSTAGEINHDSIVVTALTNPGVDNMTMYIPCGEVGILYGDVARVNIYFIDYTGAFNTENEALGYIYRYNGTEIEYIHMDFIQADLSLRPQLAIGRTYYLGVGCSAFNIPNLGRLTISYANEEFSIEIKYSTDPQVQWNYISDIQSGWVLDTLYFDCEDTSHTPTAGSENVTLSLYNMNDTLIETTYMEQPWNFNYTRAGANNTLYHKIRLIIFYNTSTYNWTETFWYTIGPSEFDTIISDPDDINIPFINIFGLSPIKITPEEAVAWTSLIALIIATFVLFTFSEKYAGLAIMGVGITLAAFKAPLGLITDDVLNWTVVIMLFVLGLFTIFIYKRRP